jgi:hypothetical protein
MQELAMAVDPLVLVVVHRHDAVKKKCAFSRLEHELRDAGVRGVCMENKGL